jgi:pyridoxal phosphate enzyme (YggS family)
MIKLSDFKANFADRLAKILSTVPDHVLPLAVTKQVDPQRVRVAYECGLRHFGESRIQEATEKQAALADLPDIHWHLIGHLQSNKAKRAIAQFDWIHSVDQLSLAQRLDRLVQEQQSQPTSQPEPQPESPTQTTAPPPRSPRLCLQVKLAPDPNKYGWEVAQLWQDIDALVQCRHLNICGLMAIPPQGLAEAETLAFFEQARELRDRLNQATGLNLTELSLGMSGDYPLAIAAGSTCIRLGRILFGDRPTPTPPLPPSSRKQSSDHNSDHNNGIGENLEKI